MKKSARLLYIINHIVSNRCVTISQIAEYCGVSERTVYRDVRDISESGMPIYYHNGYRILPGSTLPPGNLTLEELQVFKEVMTREHASDPSMETELAQSILAKVERACANLIEHGDSLGRTRSSGSTTMVSRKVKSPSSTIRANDVSVGRPSQREVAGSQGSGLSGMP